MTTPICRCRVLYLGSSVPHITKDGLQGIQEPLKELYPDQGPFTAKGIDSWLSVWSNGLLLENVDESRRQITRFFPIESLHYCAAVRYVVVPGGSSDKVEKFLPLDSPFAKNATTSQPPLFACILRRTSGIKVLECHAFIAKKETAANALVRCCFHAYADSMYAKQLEENPYYMETKRAQALTAFTSVDKVEAWRHLNGRELPERPTTNGHPAPSESGFSTTNGKHQDDDNYKVWAGATQTEKEMIYMDTSGTVRSVRSTNGGSTLGGVTNPNGPATIHTLGSRSRPRQMMLPSGPPPPPPPIPANGLRPHNATLGKDKGKKGKGGKYVPIPNGFQHNHKPMQSNGHHHAHSIYAAAGYYSERQAKRVERPGISSMEEPMYLPSNRPLSPVASYQPGAFPHEQYFMQQQQQQQQQQHQMTISHQLPVHHQVAMHHQAMQQVVMQHPQAPQSLAPLQGIATHPMTSAQQPSHQVLPQPQPLPQMPPPPPPMMPNVPNPMHLNRNAYQSIPNQMCHVNLQPSHGPNPNNNGSNTTNTNNGTMLPMIVNFSVPPPNFSLQPSNSGMRLMPPIPSMVPSSTPSVPSNTGTLPNTSMPPHNINQNVASGSMIHNNNPNSVGCTFNVSVPPPNHQQCPPQPILSRSLEMHVNATHSLPMQRSNPQSNASVQRPQTPVHHSHPPMHQAPPLHQHSHPPHPPHPPPPQFPMHQQHHHGLGKGQPSIHHHQQQQQQMPRSYDRSSHSHYQQNMGPLPEQMEGLHSRMASNSGQRLDYRQINGHPRSHRQFEQHMGGGRNVSRHSGGTSY